MRLNSRGDYCAPGSGLGVVSVNGQPIDSAGTDACWLTDDIILAQHCDQTCQIRRFNFATGEVGTEDPAGANWLRAGGGVWRAWLNGHIRGNDGFAYDGYLCDVSDEGHTVTAPPSFDALTVWNGGTITNIPTGPLGNNATSGPNVRLREDSLLWQGTDRWHLTIVPMGGEYFIAKRIEPIYFAVQVWENSRCWIIEQSGRLTARLISETNGYVITTDPVYGIDARFVDGKIVIVWSSSPGEPPEHQHVCVQDLSLPRVELNDMPPVESVPLLNRVFGFECYTFHDAVTAGNLTLPIRPTVKNWHGVIAPSDRPDIINDPQCWSVYAGENGSYTCEQAVKDARPLANARKRGLTIYQDSFPLRDDVRDMAQPHDVVSDLFLREANEMVDAFKERCRREYDRVKTGAEFWPTVNVKGEAVSAVETFITVTQLASEQHWPGLRFFAVGRDDVPMSALQPYVDRFRSGITGVPAARILPESEDEMSIAYGPVMTGFALGELKEHGDGPPYFKVVKPNGKVLCVTPDGHVEERENAGAWERFEKRGNALVAQRDLNGKPVVYVLSLA